MLIIATQDVGCIKALIISTLIVLVAPDFTRKCDDPGIKTVQKKRCQGNQAEMCSRICWQINSAAFPSPYKDGNDSPFF